jgi:hypothetical protein|tara:strand:+ start:11102 stop:12217 length:1116 start_codon:yes stop_codon:yes gene_type:complete
MDCCDKTDCGEDIECSQDNILTFARKVKKQQKCIEVGCNTRPNFNKEGEKTGIYCEKHKKGDMVNIFKKNCIEVGCNTLPSFNKEGEKTGIYCGKHRKSDMLNVINKTCIENGCNTRPHFNKVGEKTGIYCGNHKKGDMVNVINKTCIEDGCNTQPHFNKVGEKIGIYCGKHRKGDMIDVKSKKCINDHCDEFKSTLKYRGYCIPCFMNEFPDEPVVRNYKTKENTVSQYIKTKYPHLSWITDKKIQDGCSSKRPDMLVDMGTHIVITEIDENKHEDYDTICENKRIMQLSQDVGHRPIVFIRFNPDNYKKGTEKITSCWGLDKCGYCVVKKNKTKEWAERLSILDTEINYWINNEPDKMITTIKLFYDED